MFMVRVIDLLRAADFVCTSRRRADRLFDSAFFASLRVDCVIKLWSPWAHSPTTRNYNVFLVDLFEKRQENTQNVF